MGQMMSTSYMCLIIICVIFKKIIDSEKIRGN
jgi:hypothetical protein